MKLMVNKYLVYRHFSRVLGVTQECSISLTSKGSQVQSLSLPPFPFQDIFEAEHQFWCFFADNAYKPARTGLMFLVFGWATKLGCCLDSKGFGWIQRYPRSLNRGFVKSKAISMLGVQQWLMTINQRSGGSFSVSWVGDG